MDFNLHQVKGTGVLHPTRQGGCGDGGGGRLATRGGWQAAAHQQCSQGQSPIPSEDAYLGAVGLGHMAQHEERDVKEQGPNRGSFG